MALHGSRIEGLKRIRCASAPRYAYYDKPSKIRIYLDEGWLNGYCTNIAWIIRGYNERIVAPQFQPEDIEGPTYRDYKTTMTMKQALEFAIKVIRERKVSKYTPPSMKEWVKSIEKNDYNVPRKKRTTKR